MRPLLSYFIILVNAGCVQTGLSKKNITARRPIYITVGHLKFDKVVNELRKFTTLLELQLDNPVHCKHRKSKAHIAF